MPRCFHITLLLLLLPALLPAQNRKYVFNRLSTREGLAANQVYSILQDQKGFIWLGTANGLQRYDGRKMVMFRPPAPAGEYLPASRIAQIFEDRQHNFWVRTDTEVGIFDPVSFRFRKAIITPGKAIPPRSEYGLWSDRRDNIFLIITGVGVLAYDPEKHEFREDSTRIRIPKGWTANMLTEDPETGNYWIGADSGLAMYDTRSKAVYHHHHNPQQLPILASPFITNPVTAFLIDRQSRFWITTWNVHRDGQQFYCFDLKKKQILSSEFHETGGAYFEVHGYLPQADGKLWAFGHKLFSEYNEQEKRFRFIRDQHIDDYGIRYNEIYCLYEDRDENLWIGTDDGVYVFNPSREKFNNTLCLSENEEHLSVTGLLQIKNGQLLVSTWERGLFIYDSNFNKVPHSEKGMPYNRQAYTMQWCLYEDKNTGMIWVGCQEGKLMLYNPATGRYTLYDPPLLEQRTIRQIARDARGHIWLGTQYGHLVKWDPAAGYGSGFLQGFTVVQNFNTIIYKLYTDREGTLWVGTHKKGLYRVEPGSGKILAHYSSGKKPGQLLSQDIVNDIVQYNDSLFFVAAGTLHLLNSKAGAVQQITANDGTALNHINSLELDKDNMLWMGSSNGLYRYNHRRNTMTLFSQKDGIIQEGFSENVSTRLNNGKLVFGNTSGFVSFQPGQVYHAEAPRDVTITDFKLFNTYLPPDSILKLSQVQLPHSQNSITIEFASLNYLQRDKIIYYYKLEGIDRDWIRTERGLYASYNRLPPGHYTFMVMCENAEGVESANNTTLKLYIRPPFWRTWWFMALIVISIGVLIYLVHRMRVNRLLAMEKVRTRIARDLHDDMGSTLSTINILSEMAKMKVAKDNGKTAEYLEKISDNSSRMMDAMDDIVWSINPTNDSMQRITARMREFATGVLEAKNIDFTFRVDEQVTHIKLDMEARRDLFLLFKEAVNNLAKYSQCRHAVIDISVQKNRLIMKIEDDGTGFDIQHADSGNGLINMKKRAQSLKGQLLIDSRPGAGTRVLLEVPLT